MKRTELTVTLMWALVISATAGTQFVNLGRANPLPPINPKITIENPQNTTYNINTITINFTAESNWGAYSCFYSLDGSEMHPINNMTIISQEEANIGKSPPVSRTTLRGSVVLSDLTDSWHNVTFYQINQQGPFWGQIDAYGNFVELEEGEILNSVNTTFKVDTSFLTALVIASMVSVAFVGAGLLVYFNKRKR